MIKFSIALSFCIWCHDVEAETVNRLVNFGPKESIIFQSHHEHVHISMMGLIHDDFWWVFINPLTFFHPPWIFTPPSNKIHQMRSDAAGISTQNPVQLAQRHAVQRAPHDHVPIISNIFMFPGIFFITFANLFYNIHSNLQTDRQLCPEYYPLVNQYNYGKSPLKWVNRL